MIKNRLLRAQIASYISQQDTPDRELMELFVMISDTYDYYEHQLSSSCPADLMNGKPETGQACLIR